MKDLINFLIKESKIPEWTDVLKELQSSSQISRHKNHTRKHQHSQLDKHLRNLHDYLHTSLTLIEYARATVSRLVMRQIASETQAIIIKDVMSRRKDPLPLGSGTLDNIEGLEKKGIKLTKAEQEKMTTHLTALGIDNREFALFRLFRETARDIAHPDLELLPHEAINKTALDNLKTDAKLEDLGKEVVDVYWRTLRYFSKVQLDKTRKKNSDGHHRDRKNLEKINREKLREDMALLPIPKFESVVESISKLRTI